MTHVTHPKKWPIWPTDPWPIDPLPALVYTRVPVLRTRMSYIPVRTYKHPIKFWPDHHFRNIISTFQSTLKSRYPSVACRLNCNNVALSDNINGVWRLFYLGGETRRFVTLCKTAPYRNSLTYILTYLLKDEASVHTNISSWYHYLNVKKLDNLRLKLGPGWA